MKDRQYHWTTNVPFPPKFNDDRFPTNCVHFYWFNVSFILLKCWEFEPMQCNNDRIIRIDGALLLN